MRERITAKHTGPQQGLSTVEHSLTSGRRLPVSVQPLSWRAGAVAKLYGLTRDELRYILDTKDVYGPDFLGETFRVLKEKEERLYGEFRTQRLALEAWDRLDARDWH